MERWICQSHTFAELADVDAFLCEVVAVCRKHGLSISHEDGQGAFEVRLVNERDIAWLQQAHDAR